MRRLLWCLAATMPLVWIGLPVSTEPLRSPSVLAQETKPTTEQSATDLVTEPSPEPKPDAKAAEPASKPVTRKSKKRERSGSSAAKSPPYPVFDIDEVLDHLSRVGARLHKAGKTKGDVELRRQLTRKTCELELVEATETEITDAELYARACDSVFLVCSLYKSEQRGEWQTSLATAFVVAEDGVLSTSCHVFDNEDSADAIVVMDVKKNVYPVTELLASSKKSDTCLFRIDARNLKPLPLAKDAAPGTAVRIVAHPGDSFYFLSGGHVANYERDHEHVLWMNVTADFGQGSSGGPVLNEQGHVIGQVSRTFTLYAGGPETSGRPRRVAGETKPTEKPSTGKKVPSEDFMDPQMVFKSCVPVQSLRALVKPKDSSKAD